MHRQFSSRTRGGSVVGVILLVALISAAAITIDSNSKTIPNAHVAAVTTPITPPQGTCIPVNGKQVCEKDGFDYVDVNGTKMPGYRINSEAYNNITCQIGNDFILDLPRGMLFYAGKNNKPSADYSQCIPGAQSVTSTGIASRQCVSEGPQAWQCYITQCRKTANGADTCSVLSQPNGTGARRPLSIGEKIASSDASEADVKEGESTSSNDRSVLTEKDITEEEQKRIASSLDESTRTAWSSAYEEDGAKIADEKDTRIKERADVEGSLKKYTDSGACARSPECELLDARKKALDGRIVELDEQSKRLASAQRALEATRSAPDSRKEDEGNVRYIVVRDGNTFGSGDQPWYVTRPAYSDYGAYSSSNRAELEDACRRGDTRACQIIAGVASPQSGSGYRSAGSSCGSSNFGQGGLIGTVISLFVKKNNSGSQNCVNGVPVPSCTITASPTNVAAGQPVTLTWQSQDAFSANLSSTGHVAPQGSTTVNPQTTTTYTLSLEGYVNNRSGQQMRGQCAVQVTVGGQGGGDGAPKAEISCRPEVADVGMSVALSFACRNSNASGGTGFSTGNQMSGSATPVIESPTLGSSVAKYALTCSKEGKTDTAECTVQINKTSIVLIANPKTVRSGGEANIGWITSGMESCRLWSSTLNQEWEGEGGNTANTSGVAKTPALMEDAHFQLDCTTKAGGTKTAETTVTVN